MRGIGLLAAALVSGAALAAPAAAVTNFESNFDSATFAGGYGQAIVPSLEGWTAPNGIIVHAGGFQGDPDTAPNYVELDGGSHSYITRTIDPGVYSITWNYSVHPGDEASSNPIAVLVNGVQRDSVDLGDLTLDGTLWFTSQASNITVNAPTTLVFATTGTASQLGGYLDSVKVEGVALPPVPEPGEWAMLVAGLGVIGAAASRRRV